MPHLKFSGQSWILYMFVIGGHGTTQPSVHKYNYSVCATNFSRPEIIGRGQSMKIN